MNSALRFFRYITLAALLLAFQWHSGLHSPSHHLPIGKRAELAAQSGSTSPANSLGWLDVCELCSVQLATSNHYEVASPSFQHYHSSPQHAPLWLAFAPQGPAQPRAPPLA